MPRLKNPCKSASKKETRAVHNIPNKLTSIKYDPHKLRRLRRPTGPRRAAMCAVQNEILYSNTYHFLGRSEEAMIMRRDVYSGRLKLLGEEHKDTLAAAGNCAVSILGAKRFEEAKIFLRKMTPVARRVLGEGNDITLRMKRCYAEALFKDTSATLDDLRESVTTFEETARIARRVLGSAHPTALGIEFEMKASRAMLRAREPPPGSA